MKYRPAGKKTQEDH